MQKPIGSDRGHPPRDAFFLRALILFTLFLRQANENMVIEKENPMHEA
jgi:hypothetical protein